MPPLPPPRPQPRPAPNAGGQESPFAGVAAVAQRATLAMNGLQNAMGAVVRAEPTAALAGFGTVLSRVGGMFGPVGAAIGTLAAKVLELPAMFRRAADSVAVYVAAFAPVVAERYGRSWRDLTASIGEILLPVLNTATATVRFFADAVAGLRPVIRPVVDALNSMYNQFGTSMAGAVRSMVEFGAVAVQVFAPIAQTAMVLVNGPLAGLTVALKTFGEVMRTVTTAVALFLGVDLPTLQNASVGKAAANTGTTTTEGLLRQLRERAFQQPGSGAQTPAVQTVNILTAIQQFLTKLPDAMKAAADVLRAALVQKLGEEAANIATAIAKAIEDLKAGLNAIRTGGEVGAAGAVTGAADAILRLRALVPGFAG